MSKRILVTGATGYIGQVLMPVLTKLGYFVYPLTCRLHDGGGLERECHGIDVVVHGAAELKDRAKMYQSNIIGTNNLARAAAAMGVGHLVYLSTASTRDTEYVRTKRQGELIMEGWRDQMAVTVLRIPTLYGGRRGPRWLQGLKLFLQGRPINLQSREAAVQDILKAVEA